MSLAVIWLLHHCHSSFHRLYWLIAASRVLTMLFPFPSPGFKCPVCSKSVASNEMEVHFIMCLSKPRLSYNGKTRPSILSTFFESLYQFILSFSISFLSVSQFRGWKESVNCRWPLNLGLSLFLFCRGKPRSSMYMTFGTHFLLSLFSSKEFQGICRLSNYSQFF